MFKTLISSCFFASFVASTAFAYDIVKIEDFCQSKHKRVDDQKWCMTLEKGAGDLFDLALKSDPTPPVRKKVIGCLKKHPKSYVEAQPCLMKIVESLNGGDLRNPTNNLVPEFDTNSYCSKVAEAVGGSYQIEQTCREQEQISRRDVETGVVSERTLTYCSKVSEGIGGSYQILKSCIDQETVAKDSLQ